MESVICQPAANFSIAEGYVGLLFLLTVGIIIFGAFIATTSKRLVRCVAALALCFTGVAGIYYFLLSPFVAMMQMLIYVGAVSILIAFAVMLAEPEDHSGSSTKGSLLAGPFGVGIGAFIFAALATMGLKTEWQSFPKQGSGDIEQLGKALLTSHSLVFELISIVLLIAIIGALVLARKGRSRA